MDGWHAPVRFSTAPGALYLGANTPLAAIRTRDKEWPTLLFTFNEMHMLEIVAGSLLQFYYTNERFLISSFLDAPSATFGYMKYSTV
jgi:hypothetical protein